MPIVLFVALKPSFAIRQAQFAHFFLLKPPSSPLVLVTTVFHFFFLSESSTVLNVLSSPLCFPISQERRFCRDLVNPMIFLRKSTLLSFIKVIHTPCIHFKHWFSAFGTDPALTYLVRLNRLRTGVGRYMTCTHKCDPATSQINKRGENA